MRLLPRLTLALSLFVAAPASRAGGLAAAPATPLARDFFLSELARDLSAHFNLEGDLQLELIRSWSPPAKVAAQWTIEIAEYPSLASSSMLVRTRILADGALLADSAIVLRATHQRDVWAARQPVLNGATFDPADLEVRRVDLFRERDALPAAVGDRSFAFTRSIAAGRLLTWRDIGRRPLVKKGSLVEVSAGEGLLLITMKAVAMENGAQGETVTVRNQESRKDFAAMVVDENRVQVRF